jgi:hypothetical protein
MRRERERERDSSKRKIEGDAWRVEVDGYGNGKETKEENRFHTPICSFRYRKLLIGNRG